MSHTMNRQHIAVGINTIVVVSVIITLAAWNGAASAASVFLDADSPATGSNLANAPLVTPLGNITFVGEIRDRDSDPEFNAAGALGNVFDIVNSASTATMSFGF